MKRTGTAKFPHSVQLFKFCQKVMMHQRNGKVRDQEVGAILNFNPSDCSHWKRGEKNVKSVFALAKLAESLQVEVGLIHDLASGNIRLDEAYFEYMESRYYETVLDRVRNVDAELIGDVRGRVENFVDALLEQCDFSTPPLYLPEVVRLFSFISTQSVEMIDKLSRILRVRPGQYCIHYRKGDLKPQTRLSMIKDVARIIFEGERARFPELGEKNEDLLGYEATIFAANLLAPKAMIAKEMAKLDLRRNVVAELATLFWVPKSIICFQLQDVLRTESGDTIVAGTQANTGTVVDF